VYEHIEGISEKNNQM